VEGTKTSTLSLPRLPRPPEMMIPGMEIIIRVLLPVLLTLCSREPGHVQAGSTDTSHGQEEKEGQPCNHHLLTARYSSTRRLVLDIFSAIIYTN
jgi:hypothetical protein